MALLATGLVATSSLEKSGIMNIMEISSLFLPRESKFNVWFRIQSMMSFL